MLLLFAIPTDSWLGILWIASYFFFFYILLSLKYTPKTVVWWADAWVFVDSYCVCVCVFEAYLYTPAVNEARNWTLPLAEQCCHPPPPHLLLLFFLISSLQCPSLYWLHCKCCPYSSQSKGKPKGHAAERLIENERLERHILEKKMEENSNLDAVESIFESEVNKSLRITLNLFYCCHDCTSVIKTIWHMLSVTFTDNHQLCFQLISASNVVLTLSEKKKKKCMHSFRNVKFFMNPLWIFIHIAYISLYYTIRLPAGMPMIA